MHNLSLGLSKMLRSAAFQLQRAKHSLSLLFVLFSITQQFKSIRRSGIQRANEPLTEIGNESRGYGLHVHFGKGEQRGGLSGIFTDDEVMRILQATYYETFDIVPPLIGALIETCGGNTDSAFVTNAVILYVDLVEYLSPPPETSLDSIKCPNLAPKYCHI